METLDDQAENPADAQVDEVIDEDSYQKDVKNLNVGQKTILKRVKDHLKKDEELANAKEPLQEPLRIFITGGAGTGKSHVLKTTRTTVRRFFKTSNKCCDPVKTFAPTGCAARLIKGTTLHSGLRLPVESDGKLPKYAPLYGAPLKNLRRAFEGVEVIIIDKISMVSFQLFEFINKRLQEVSSKPDGQNKLFGGYHVLLFGDLLQLPPVPPGTVIFKLPLNHRGVFLWRQFDFFELQQNMRQKEDDTFFSLLNNLRVEQLTDEQKQLIRQRVNKEKLDEKWSDFNATRIFATNAPAETHNANVLDNLVELENKKGNDIKVYEFLAADRWISKDKTVNQKKNISDFISKKSRSTGGVPTVVKLAVGARVMLRYNINIEDGLVNGALGTVKLIKWCGFFKVQPEPGRLPQYVEIDFDGVGPRQVQLISLIISATGGHGKIERIQLPLILAYGISAHKLQGMTLETAVIDMGRSVFARGQPNVMMSRLKKLENLILCDLDERKLGEDYVNKDARKEMTRLKNLPETVINVHKVKRMKIKF